MTPDRSEKLLMAGIDSIKISVNAGPKSYALVHGMDAFEKVCDNIRAFDQLRKKYSKQCSLYISYVAVRQTKDEVEEVKELLSPYVDEIIVMNANNRGGSVYEGDAALYEENDEYSFTYPCSQIFNNVYVTAEGYMVICCQDFENLTVVADLNNESVAQAWNNKTFTEFRQKYLQHDLHGTLCQNCLYNTCEKVVPLTPQKAYYTVSERKVKDLQTRIKHLVEGCAQCAQ